MSPRTKVAAHARVPWWRNRHVLVPLYFWCGGLSGGTFALGALAELAQPPGTAHVATLAHRVAFPLIAFGSILLLLDLTRPLRFFRLLTHFNPRSPVSLGSFGLVAYGGFAFLFAAAPFLGIGALPRAIVALALASALFIASYTGILLTASSKPAWNASPMMGGIFLSKALANGAALLILLESATATGASSHPVDWLRRFLLASLGVHAVLMAYHLWRVQRVPAAERAGIERLLHGRLGLAFFAALALSTAAPLVLPLRIACASVLVGGLLLRYAIFLAEE